MGSDFDLQSWINGLDLTEEEKKTLQPVLAKEPVSKKLRESFLMRSDYSKKMDGIQKQKEELEAQIKERVEKLEAYEQGLVSWKSDSEKVIQKNQSEVQKLTEQLQKKDAAMMKIAEEYGLDTSQYMQSADIGREPTQPVVRGVDPETLSKYIDKDTFNKAVADAQNFPYVAAELAELNSEHYELFGKPLKGQKALVAEAIKQKKGLRDLWAEQNKVEEHRAEMAKKAHDEELDRVRQETETRVRSELKIPATRPDSQQPLILSDKLKSKEETRQHGQASDRSIVESALAAYASGKYGEQNQ